MKKITAILASAVAGVSAVSGQELSISSTVAWESAYVFRGVQYAEEFFAPSIDLSYAGFYAGIWAALPVDSKFNNEVDFYAGYSLAIDETMSLDFGSTYYTYPDLGSKFFDTVNSLEFYAGLSFEVPYSPSAYVFYDIDLEVLTFEVSAGHSIEVAEQSSVELSAHLGWVDPDAGSSYLYYGAGAAYVYAFNDNASVKVGVNWYGCEEDYMLNNKSNKFSFVAAFTAGF